MEERTEKPCPHCERSLSPAAEMCPECGHAFDTGRSELDRAASYFGAIVMFFFGLTCFAPVEGYDMWYSAGAVFLATGAMTLPEVRDYLTDEYAYEFTRGTVIIGWVTGLFLGLALIPT